MALSETVRNNIEKMMNEATKNITMNDTVKHMMTQICFEMYKHGVKDGFRISKICIETAAKDWDK